MSELSQDSANVAEQSVRKVTIYSTKTGSKQSIESSSSTYGPLKKEISKLGIDVDKFLVTETGKKVTYELNEAELPSGPFFLIIRPKETKSGAKAADVYPLNRKELMSAIKDAVHADPKLKEKLGGNVTQMKTPLLEAFHKKHIAGKTFNAPKVAAKKEKVKKETPKQKIAKVEKVSTPKVKEEKKAKVSKTNGTEESNGVGEVVGAVAEAKKSEDMLSKEQWEKQDREETEMLANMSKSLFKK